jgi:glycine betaine/choline ABC-type transport system substrate-binding protein
MPRVTRAGPARRQEEALLRRPRQAALLTAAVVAVTAVVFALAAYHGTLARIQRVDDAWLRLMISGRTPPLAGRPSAAQDANVIVVTAATAARYGLRSVADLARVAPRLAFGGPPECPERAYCLLGLKQVYGLRFRFLSLDAGGPLTLQALQAGDIGVALLFSTDPAITADHLVVLADDRGLQPAENVVPLVRRDAIARYGPRLLAALDTVSARLTTGSLRALDAQVELRGDNPGSVARTWLRAQGLISAGGAAQ